MEKLKIEVVKRTDSFDIKNVQLFEVTWKAEKSQVMTKEKVESYIKIHNKLKAEKWFLPTVFVGHNGWRVDEGEAIWFFDNIRVIGTDVYVDFVNMFSDWYDKLKRYPYRSMEIIDGQITWIAVLGSNSPYFMNEPLMYSKDDEGKRESYFLPTFPEQENPAWQGDKETVTYFISTNQSLMEFTKENFEKLAQEAVAKDAQIEQFKKDNEGLKTSVTQFEQEKANAEVFAKVGTQVEAFAKNGKIAFSKDEDKDAMSKFAASLPDENARTEFFSILGKLVAVKGATTQYGADEGDGAGEGDGGGADKDKEKTDEAKESEAQAKADEFMKSGKFTDRSLALREAYKTLKIVE